MSFAPASQRVVIRRAFVDLKNEKIVSWWVDKIVDKKRTFVDKWKSLYVMPKPSVLSPPPPLSIVRLWTTRALWSQRRA